MKSEPRNLCNPADREIPSYRIVLLHREFHFIELIGVFHLSARAISRSCISYEYPMYRVLTAHYLLYESAFSEGASTLK